MNPYLTQKAVEQKSWHWAVAAVCGAFAAAFVSAFPEYFRSEDAAQISVGIFLTLAFLYPPLRMGRNILLRSEAEKIANWFAYYRENSVTFEKLAMETKPGVVKSIDFLLKKGYLRNLHMDYEHGVVELTAEQRLVRANIYEIIICPCCGGKNQIIKGRICKCIFCDQPLPTR